jgi:hypothetical protein
MRFFYERYCQRQGTTGGIKQMGTHNGSKMVVEQGSPSAPTTLIVIKNALMVTSVYRVVLSVQVSDTGLLLILR